MDFYQKEGLLGLVESFEKVKRQLKNLPLFPILTHPTDRTVRKRAAQDMYMYIRDAIAISFGRKKRKKAHFGASFPLLHNLPQSHSDANFRRKMHLNKLFTRKRKKS